MTRVLVTGASGFVGSALVPELGAAGYQVRAAARRHSIHPSAGIELVEMPDMARPMDWSTLLGGVDVIVHLAGIAHRRRSGSADYDQVNRGAVADLAAACAQHNVKRLIFMSSIGAQAGGAAIGEIDEDSIACPVTAYDRAKLAAEEAVKASGTPFVILRPVVVYGANAKANVALLLRLAAMPIPLPFGAFRNRRSLLALENLVSAVQFCLESPAVLNDTFIVSDPEPIALRDVFAVLRLAMGRQERLLQVPPAWIERLLRAAGKQAVWDRIGRDLVASSRKLQHQGWTPPLTTERGLRALSCVR